MESAVRTKALKFIKQNSKMSFAQFKKVSNIKINSCHYYDIRKEIFPHGIRANSVAQTCVYINLTTVPLEGISEETKAVLSKIIRGINEAEGTRMEILENVRDKTLEIRKIGLK